MVGSSVLTRLVGRSWFGLTVGAMVTALVVAGAPGPAVAAQPVPRPSAAPEAAPVGSQSDPATAPDETTARRVALLTGSPVEVLGERTEQGSVFAMPDGTMTAGRSAGPVWVRRGGDGTHEQDWAAVDLTLQAGDGVVQPVAQSAGLHLSGGSRAGGSVEVASVTDAASGVRLSMSWDGVLPTPTLTGRRATYADVQPGIDLVVEATATGFEEFFVVRSRPAAGGDLSLPLSVTSTGGAVQKAPDGGLQVVEGDKVVAVAPAPQMWDARADVTRAFPVTKARPGEVTKVQRMAPMPASTARSGKATSVPRAAEALGSQAPGAVTGDPSATSGPSGQAADSSAVVTGGQTARVEVRPQASFLQDPATVYPVVVDPDVSLSLGFDTFVVSGQSNLRSGMTELDVGTWNGGGNVARAFVTFPVSPIAGKQVSSATLWMYNFYSWSCQERTWEAHNTDPANASTIWSNQPAWGQTWGSSSGTLGYSSSCAGGWVTADVTSLAQTWAAQSATQGFVGIKAANEADNYGWKKFYSADNGAGVPTIWVTYNSAPSTPTGLQVSPAANPTVSGTYTSSLTPRLSATLTDPDGENVDGNFYLYDGSSNAEIWKSPSGFVTNGAVASLSVPAGLLAEGKAYYFKVRGSDWKIEGPASAPLWFGVDTLGPAVPRVASQDYPADSAWHKDGGQPGAFTFAMVLADPTVAGYRWGLDQAPVASQQVAVTNGAAGSLTLTPATAGRHTLQVQSVDRAGNVSAVFKHTFLVGRAGIVSPQEGTRVVRRVRLSTTTNDSSLTFVKYQWRRGPDSTVITDVAPGALSTSSGDPWAAGLNQLPGAGGYSAWDAGLTLGLEGGPIQVRAVLATDSAGTGPVQTAWVTLVVDPDAQGAAADQIGPGSVNLLTGDYRLTSTDAKEFGLSLVRTTSSRDTDAGYQLQPENLTSTAQRDGSAVNAGEITNVTATVTSSTTQFHQGGSSFKVTATSATVDTYAAVGGDAGGLRLGLVAGGRYRISAWVYVPAATGLAPDSARGESVALFTRVGSGPYSEPSTSGQQTQTPRPSKTDTWQQVSVDVTIPAGATEAFIRLYNGFNGAAGKVVYFDDLSVRQIWAPFGPQWELGTIDENAGTAYTSISQPESDVAAVRMATGQDVWFTSADGTTWFPEPGAESLSLSRTSTSTWRLSEIDGTYTDFTRAGSTGTFAVATTSSSPASTGSSRYVYSPVAGVNRLTRIIAPIEPGVDGWVDGTTGNVQACTTATPAKGCEVMDLTYATSTTATTTTPGSFTGQVSSVSVWLYNAATSTMVSTPVATYAYDSTGRLVQVQDPRLVTAGSQAQPTSYAYDTAGRVTTLTPAGEPGYTFAYGQAGATKTGAGDFIDSSPGRLLSVSRASLLPGTNTPGPVNTTTVVYCVPLTRTVGGPYDLGTAQLATWSQSDGPTDATAVFGPQSVPTVTTATSTTPGADGFKTASVHYLNASGLEVDTASPVDANAPVEGYIDVTAYDSSGNTTRTLDATNRLLALGKLPDTAAKLDALGLTGKSSIELSTLLDSRSSYSPDGLDLISQVGPVQKMAVANDPADVRLLRAQTINVYDEGKPDGANHHLVTTTTTAGLDTLTQTTVDAQTTTNGYNPIDGASPLGKTSGWVHGQATRVTVDAGGANETTSTVLYDSAGRPVSSSKPGSSGTDAGTTTTLYYTAGTNAADAACGNHPEWAGQPCLTAAAGAVTGAATGRMAPTLTRKRVSAYNAYGDPTVVAESSTGPVAGLSEQDVRTTTTTYDAADRVTKVEMTGTGSAAGAPVAATGTVYDPATGEVTAVQSLSSTGAVLATVARAYDVLGHLTSYTDATGATTTTTYDRYGRPAHESQTIAGTTVGTDFAYDDPRGYVTSFTDSVAGTINATWGPDGQLTKQSLPGGIDLLIGYDPAGTPTSRTYQRASDSVVIFNDQVVENHRGQWISHTSTTAAMTYAYDRLGRLTAVTDTPTGGACTARAYAYDMHTNRTGFATATSPDATCPTVTAAAWGSYDSADRLVSTTGTGGTSWTYDPFGRTTSMPTAAGQLSNEYYVNDLVAAQTIPASARYTWSLDPVGRRATNVQQTWTNGAWANAVTKVCHYATDSDEPAWIAEDASLPTAVTRYVSGVEGDIAVTTSATGGRVVQLVDLHGDVVGTVPIADGASTATWSGLLLQRTDEFGNPEPLTGAGATTGPPARYGWLGAAQRSAEALGQVVLMGVRLYSSVTGRFLQPDPVPGGSANAYDYCTGDPVNCTDLAGTRINWGKVLKVVAVVGEIASMVPGPIGAAAGAVSAVAYAATGNKTQALVMAATAAAALVGAGAAVRVAAKVAGPAIKAGVAATRAAPRIERAASFVPWNSTKRLSSFGNAAKHFNTHGAGVGAPNLRRYVVDANKFLSSRAPALTRTRASDGAFVRWNPISNRIGIRTSSGAPKTYFKARSRSEGWNQFRSR